MKYRILGRTGISVSEIGLGGHEYRRKHLVKDGRFTELDPKRTQLVAEALERGVNYFDTTFIEECQSLGHSIRSAGIKRERMIISGMSIDILNRKDKIDIAEWRKFAEKEITERLALLNTDHFDVFHICALESGYSADKLSAVLSVMQEWRKRGLIRFIGASAHDSDLLAEVIEERDPFDVVMARLNYHSGRHERLLEAVKNRNVGLAVIKPLVWFDYGVSFVPLCKSIIEARKVGNVGAAQMALAWILQQPEVSTIIPSANSIDELRENAGASELSAEAVDYDLLEACNAMPDRSVEMINLLDHPFEEVKLFAKQALVRSMGADFGFDKERYRETLLRS